MDESAAIRQRGVILIIIGIVLFCVGIFLVAFLSSWFYYGALCIFCGVVASIVGASYVYNAHNRNRVTRVHTTQQAVAPVTGPTMVTTTGTAYGQFGPPPPAYGQYPASNQTDFPPGLAPGDPSQQGPNYPDPSGQPPPYGGPATAPPGQAPPYGTAPPGTYGKDPGLPGQPGGYTY